MTGIARIRAELMRQRQLGWTKDHDFRHQRGELLAAAICYAVPPNHRALILQAYWPQSWEYHQSKNRMKELVKAGALVAAEIERLDALEKEK